MLMTPDVMTLAGHIILGVLGVIQTALIVWNTKMTRKIDRNTNGKNGIPHD